MADTLDDLLKQTAPKTQQFTQTLDDLLTLTSSASAMPDEQRTILINELRQKGLPNYTRDLTKLEQKVNSEIYPDSLNALMNKTLVEVRYDYFSVRQYSYR